MHRRTRRAVAFGLAGAVLALPGAAQAKTKSVWVGTPPKNAKALQDLGVDVNDYFPHKVTIRRGDKVRVRPGRLPQRRPAPARRRSAAARLPDRRGRGRRQRRGRAAVLVQRPAAARLHAGARPDALRQEGLLQRLEAPPERPAARAGRQAADGDVQAQGQTFTYYCNVHAGMKGIVSVKKKGAKVPSKKADKKAVRRQVEQQPGRREEARRRPRRRPTRSTSAWPAADGEELFAFVPSAVDRARRHDADVPHEPRARTRCTRRRPVPATRDGAGLLPRAARGRPSRGAGVRPAGGLPERRPPDARDAHAAVARQRVLEHRA